MPSGQIPTLMSENHRERAQSVLTVCGIAWGLFGVYWFITGSICSSSICLMQVTVSYLVMLLLPKVDLKLLLHFYIGSALVALTAEGLVSGQAMSETPYFLSCLVLLSAHQLGPRAAVYWSVGSIVSIMFVHFGLSPGTIPVLRVSTPLDRFLAHVVIVVLTCAFSVYAEMAARRYASSIHTISDELKDQARQLNEMVCTDTLTGLANRHQLHTHVNSLIEHCRDNNQLMAILLIDLNGFKPINDTLGHAAGDEVLRIVAERMREAVGHNCLITRLGGDEFTVVVENPKNELEVVVLAGNIVRSISRDLELDDRQVDLGASIGISIYPQHAETTDQLLSMADAAMYEAKSQRCGVRVFEEEMLKRLDRRREVDVQLRESLSQDEFSLVYQPQVRISDNRIVGMEALLRLKRDGEYIMPDEFIPQLESSGFIVEVGRWIFNEACMQVRRWQQRGYELNMSINVSPIQFHHNSFLNTVWDAIESNGIDPSLLDIEFTETVLLDDAEVAIAKIDMLRESGISISIDDFGTGYSSLAYLKSLPISRLKIDRSFIKDYPSNDDGIIASTIIALAHNLGMTVIAEGVDSEAQLEFLRKNGCEEYQGYLFSKPLEWMACESLLIKESKSLEGAVYAESIECGVLVPSESTLQVDREAYSSTASLSD